MKIPKDVVLIWPGLHSAIPTNYIRETSLDGLFPKAWGDSIDPNTTGGAATHTHTSPTHSHTLNSHTHTYTLTSAGTTSSGSGPAEPGFRYAIVDTHTHTGTSGGASGGTTSSDAVTYGSVSNNPPYTDVIFVKAQNGALLADGIGVLWSGYGGDVTIPDNYQLLDGTNSTLDLRDKYIRGAATSQDAGGTGGSYTNVHDISHSHTSNAHSHVSAQSNQSANQNAGGSVEAVVKHFHTHAVTLADSTETITSYSGSLTTPETVEPLYIKVCALVKKTGAIKEKGIIGLWLGDLDAIPEGWVLCNGENGTLDLRDRFIKIAHDTSEIGDAGGANSHTHASQSHAHSSGSHSHSGSASAHVNDGSGEAGASNSFHRTIAGSVHPVGSISTATAGYASANTTANSSSNEPEYRVAAYIQFQKDLYGGAALQAFL